MKGLSKHLFYEDLIAEQAGFEVEAVERPYTTFQLIDPHVQAFRVNLEDVASQLQKREESRRLWENIKRAAAERGVTPGEVVVGMGLHRNKSPVATFNPSYEAAKIQAEHSRMADLMSLHQRVQENNAAAARDIEDALARHGSTTEALAAGPMEAAGEVVGEASGALLDRFGSGGRSEAASDLSRRGGKFLLKNTGKVVDSVGNAILGGLGLDDPYRVEA